MKKTTVISLLVLLLGAVIAIGSVSFLGPCVHEDGSFGACHWAGRAMLGIGVLLALQGAVALFCRDGGIRAGLMISSALTALLGLLTPGQLIALCGMATMRCRAVMQPAMRILCGAVLLISVIGVIAERKRTGEQA
ncbi:MAG: DUF4418 family protein [Oscillospiraceae bacterium]|nr:DUF4418 family protein [Oscillospiraceae bacterium]